MSGTVQGIFIASSAEAPMQSLERVMAIAGIGLEGDRYAKGIGFYTPTPTTPGAREITLMAEEAVSVASESAGVPFAPVESRRNLITRDADLKALMGMRFSIGPVVCEGVRDCPPCVHLDALTGKSLMAHLVWTGGLRARIVTGGEIQIGDQIKVLGAAEGPVHGRNKS